MRRGSFEGEEAAHCEVQRLPSMCVSDAAFCQITLTTCHCMCWCIKVLSMSTIMLLQAKVANAKIGFGKAKAHGWVELVKCDNGLQKVARKVCVFHFHVYFYRLLKLLF